MHRNTVARALAVAVLPGCVALALPALSAEPTGSARQPVPQQSPDEEKKDKEKDKDKDASPSPSPSPSPSASPTVAPPVGDETGCRDVVRGRGDWVRPVTLPAELGQAPMPVGKGVLNFEVELAAPSCPGVTYTFTILRNDGTELTRVVRSGGGDERNVQGAPVVTVREVLDYAGTCIAIDVEVREGDVVHDVAPDVRDAHKDLCDTGKPGSPGQFWN